MPNEHLAERIAKLEAEQANMLNVLRKLGEEMDKLSNAVVDLKISMARVIGVATVLMPLLGYAVPKVMNHIWP